MWWPIKRNAGSCNSCLSHKTHPFLCWKNETNKRCNSDSCLHILPRRFHETRVHGHRNKCAAWANLITVRAHYVNIRKRYHRNWKHQTIIENHHHRLMHLPFVSSDTFFLLFCSVYLGSGFRWQNHDTAIWWLMWLAILNAFPKSSSESFSQPQSVLENSGTNLSGFAEVWSQRQDSARLKGQRR